MSHGDFDSSGVNVLKTCAEATFGGFIGLFTKNQGIINNSKKNVGTAVDVGDIIVCGKGALLDASAMVNKGRQLIVISTNTAGAICKTDPEESNFKKSISGGDAIFNGKSITKTIAN